MGYAKPQLIHLNTFSKNFYYIKDKLIPRLEAIYADLGKELLDTEENKKLLNSLLAFTRQISDAIQNIIEASFEDTSDNSISLSNSNRALLENSIHKVADSIKGIKENELVKNLASKKITTSLLRQLDKIIDKMDETRISFPELSMPYLKELTSETAALEAHLKNIFKNVNAICEALLDSPKENKNLKNEAKAVQHSLLQLPSLFVNNDTALSYEKGPFPEEKLKLLIVKIKNLNAHIIKKNLVAVAKAKDDIIRQISPHYNALREEITTLQKEFPRLAQQQMVCFQLLQSILKLANKLPTVLLKAVASTKKSAVICPPSAKKLSFTQVRPWPSSPSPLP